MWTEVRSVRFRVFVKSENSVTCPNEYEFGVSVAGWSGIGMAGFASKA